MHQAPDTFVPEKGHKKPERWSSTMWEVKDLQREIVKACVGAGPMKQPIGGGGGPRNQEDT